MRAMNTPASLRLPSGHGLPALGLGTWRMGESRARRNHELAALRSALDMGYRLFDTAEMYAEGGAEELLGEALTQALRGPMSREQLFIVTKVYPHNASAQGMLAACERSRRRLQLDHVDLYLLHWRGDLPLRQTVEGFERLQQLGWIRHWGVSNFDLAGMQDLQRVDGQGHCATNQVWYSASQRGVEFDLLPWQREHGMPQMAYSPIDQAALARSDVLEGIGRRIGASAAQVALAWVLRDDRVIAIPKAVTAEHLRDNLAAANLVLDTTALAAIDSAFPPPTRKSALAMI